MIKPAVCEKDLCVHAHEQYGLGADVASEIRDFPDVVDLLISFCYAITGEISNLQISNPQVETIEDLILIQLV